MKITYVHHSAFLVELTSAALLFDYTQGPLPELDKNKPLIIFASHRHGDHYSEKIFDLGTGLREVHYVLSDDISKKKVREELRERVIFVKPEETFWLSYNDGRNTQLEVTAFDSTDEGVAFLIKGDGAAIYHAGDLNNWRWEGEPEEWNRDMAKKYSLEVDKLSGVKIDAAFLPLDPRQEGAFYLGFDEFMRKAEVLHAFPMHCWGNFSVIGQLKAMEVSAPYRDRIIMIERDGESFILGQEPLIHE
nr:MBL fold metallo-hydrolase [uncultured Clostridium sp.]